MQVIILSGLPGSGKSTLARECLLPEWERKAGRLGRAEIVSADDFHMIGKLYCFDPNRVGQAHDWCMINYLGHVQDAELDLLIVDNTNTSAVEIAPYLRVAQALGVDVKVIRLWCAPPVAFKRNVHEVPLGTIMAMHHRMIEPLPPYWPVEHRVADTE